MSFAIVEAPKSFIKGAFYLRYFFFHHHNHSRTTHMATSTNSGISPAKYIRNNSSFTKFNTYGFLQTLGCKSRDKVKLATAELLDKMLGFQDLSKDTQTFIYHLKDLKFLEDMDAERYWDGIHMLQNSQAQVSLYNNSVTSTIGSAKRVKSKSIKSKLIKYGCNMILNLTLLNRFKQINIL